MTDDDGGVRGGQPITPHVRIGLSCANCGREIVATHERRTSYGSVFRWAHLETGHEQCAGPVARPWSLDGATRMAVEVIRAREIEASEVQRQVAAADAPKRNRERGCIADPGDWTTYSRPICNAVSPVSRDRTALFTGEPRRCDLTIGHLGRHCYAIVPKTREWIGTDSLRRDFDAADWASRDEAHKVQAEAAAR